jgi:DNA-binding CsgD family transcriptional regulator
MLALGGNASLPLVGRDAELSLLDASVERLTRGQPARLVITGEAGIGKTSMLAELIARSERCELPTFVGRGQELDRDAPFGAIVDALDAPIAALDDGQLDELGPDRLAELASVLPSLATRASGLARPLQAERFRVHYAVRAAVQRLGAHGPVVLVFDDLHHADDASIEVVSHLLQRPSDAPILIAIAYRPNGAPPRLHDAVASAVRRAGVTEMALAPLSPADADRLIHVDVDVPLRRALYRQSGGNPFYLIELERAVDSGERLELSTTERVVEYGTPPPAVSTAIGRELGRLRPTARDLLRAAAVIGDPFDVDLGAEVAGLPEALAFDALDELLAADLLRPTSTPRDFEFRHPIVRRAVYDAGPEDWFMLAHGRAAGALARRGAGLTARAHHVERSAGRGDEEAIALLTEAAHAVSARAPATAAAWFGAAGRLLPDDAGAERRLALLLPRAAALTTTGHIAEARATLVEAFALIPEQLPIVRAQFAGALAKVDHMLGRRTEARTLLAETLASVDPRSAAATIVHLDLTIDHWFSAEWAAMAVAGERALGVAREVEDPLFVAEASATTGLARYGLGDIVAAQRFADDARRLIDGLSDDQLAARLYALLFAGQLEHGLERLDESVGHIERGIRIARATGQSSYFAFLTGILAIAQLWRGRLDLAVEAANSAHESSLVEQSQLLLWATTLRCWTMLLTGDLHGAIDEGEQAVALAEAWPSVAYGWLAHGCLAAALIEAGEHDRALRAILDHAGGAELSAVEVSWRPRWFELLAVAEIGRGELERAEAWVRRAEDGAAALGLDGRFGEALRARSALELARGNTEGAAEAGLAAAARFDPGGYRIEAARARILAGRALARLGRTEQATAELQHAHAVLEECGGQRYRQEAATELRRLGRRARRPIASSGVAALTRRERDVAELVARGMTNAQIAKSLFLSEKTVESHLSRMFRKLGVGSRSALAAVVERERQSSDP